VKRINHPLFYANFYSFPFSPIIEPILFQPSMAKFTIKIIRVTFPEKQKNKVQVVLINILAFDPTLLYMCAIICIIC